MSQAAPSRDPFFPIQNQGPFSLSKPSHPPFFLLSFFLPLHFYPWLYVSYQQQCFDLTADMPRTSFTFTFSLTFFFLCVCVFCFFFVFLFFILWKTVSGGCPFKYPAEGRILWRTVSGGRPFKYPAEGRILWRTVSGGRPFKYPAEGRIPWRTVSGGRPV